MQQPPRPQIFISHASPEKLLARPVVHRLVALGFEPWLDEEVIQPGQPFPDRLKDALRASSHLLVLLTPAWIEARWTQVELERFLAENPAVRSGRVVPLLPERLERSRWPALLQEQAAIEAWELTSAQVDWLLYCAIAQVPAGPRERWAARARQVQEEQGPLIDFSNEELLEWAQRALTASPAPTHLARNLALYCLRLGLSPAWIEPTWPAEELPVMYRRALEAAPAIERPAIWDRCSWAARRVGQPPAGLTEQVLLQAVLTAQEELQALAALRLLSLRPLSARAIRLLTGWLDPDARPDAPQPAMRPQLRGHLRTVDATLELLFRQRTVRPLKFFQGLGSTMISEAGWWTCYFRRLLELARTGQLPWPAVALRLQQALQSATSPDPILLDPEQLDALGMALGELSELPPELATLAQQLMAALRYRVGEQSSQLTLRLAELLIERLPRVVFLHLSGGLYRFTKQDGQRAARLTGLAAQDPDDVVELLGRLPQVADPEERALLWEAALGSPASLADPAEQLVRLTEAAGVLEASAPTLLTLLDTDLLRQFQATVETDSWPTAAPAFLREQPRSTQVFWPYVLAREFGHADAEPSRRWRGLCRCLVLESMLIAAEASPFVSGAEPSADLRTLGQPLEPDVWPDHWDRAAATIMELGSDLTRRGDELQAQLRWLQVQLRTRGEQTGKLRLLEARLRAWFAAQPDLTRSLTARPTITFRFSLTQEPLWGSLALLLEDPAVTALLQPAVDGEALHQAVRSFIHSDEARTVAHRLGLVDEMCSWAVRLLTQFPQPETTGWLWGLLQRKHAYRCSGLTEAQQHAELLAALLRGYEEAGPALLASLERLVLDVETRVQLLLGLYRQQRPFGEEQLLRELAALQQEPALAELLIEGLEALASQPPSSQAVPVLRALGDSHNPAVAGAAIRALLATSAAPEDLLRAIRLGLREPTVRAQLRQALDRANRA